MVPFEEGRVFPSHRVPPCRCLQGLQRRGEGMEEGARSWGSAAPPQVPLPYSTNDAAPLLGSSSS